MCEQKDEISLLRICICIQIFLSWSFGIFLGKANLFQEKNMNSIELSN